MRRAEWLLLTLFVGACLEPGDFSNAGAIYEAVNARDGGRAPNDGGSGSGGSGASGGSGGMGGSGGSGGMGGSGGAADASTGNDCGDVLEDLIKPTCGQSVCHSTATAGPLDVEAPSFASRLLGAEASTTCEGEVYIDPDDASNSLIYTKLDDNPPCGLQMPLSPPLLTAAQKACMLEYLEGIVAAQ
jgi:hypothetical protein